MDLKEVGCEARNWMDFAVDRDQWRAYVREIMNQLIIYVISRDPQISRLAKSRKI